MKQTSNRALSGGATASKGFTLIEILVVMAIIAMLAVMVAPNLFRQQAGAMRDVALTEISTLEAALDIYRLDVGEYPDSLEGLMENDTDRAYDMAIQKGDYIQFESDTAADAFSKRLSKMIDRKRSIMGQMGR